MGNREQCFRVGVGYINAVLFVPEKAKYISVFKSNYGTIGQWFVLESEFRNTILYYAIMKMLDIMNNFLNLFCC